MSLDELKEILSLFSNKTLVSISAILLFVLAFLITSFFLIARKTITNQVNDFLEKINSFEKDIIELKKAMISHTRSLEDHKRDFDSDLSLNKDTIVAVFNETREKAFTQISELTILSNRLQSKTEALSEVFSANAEALEMKLDALVESRKETQEYFGKVRVIEKDLGRVRHTVVRIVEKLQDAGIVKKKASGK